MAVALEFYRQHAIDYWIVEPGQPWGEIEIHAFGTAGIEPTAGDVR